MEKNPTNLDDDFLEELMKITPKKTDAGESKDNPSTSHTQSTKPKEVSSSRSVRLNKNQPSITAFYTPINSEQSELDRKSINDLNDLLIDNDVLNCNSAPNIINNCNSTDLNPKKRRRILSASSLNSDEIPDISNIISQKLSEIQHDIEEARLIQSSSQQPQLENTHDDKAMPNQSLVIDIA